ncbi:D-alanine-D-alanine ligase [Actinobaculum suis]|uniref:ATP-grasp domain-containing protein n=2 Tax=Actinobaculum suis TaxID=1657 RepID=A0A1B9BE75_9ACTO|nr:ATP-grasp domain-containing protein [Actinobaculum suis]MDY5152699.1 ATP-grasp domain-containing protein [Actinobaculum suis]OCA95073.1 D-alanine--D-alanine ligase [Actinobaculum suis]OCA95787.1 D-alanine--D-alanine ligase [Actinobaculum suis]SDE09629.1 D-alanine-D-alanine ligase [Actinobaculum suis]
MSKVLTVAILAGGLTHERDVSLSSGRRVASLLREAGMNAKVLDVDASLLQRLDSMNPDVVWPLVHGTTGEDGALQDLLSLAGYTFVGSTANAARTASSKAGAQSTLRHAGLQVPWSVTFPEKLFREIGVAPILDLLGSKIGFPLVVKPNLGGSALGVSIVSHEADLPRAMVDCFAYGEAAHVESYVEGTEIAVSVLELDGEVIALPPVEIDTDGPYDYDARYNAGRAEYFIPARLPEAVIDSAKEAAIRAHQVLRLRDISRIDMIVSDSQPIIIDANVAPGMTETSLLPQAVEAFSRELQVPVEDIYLQILRTAANRANGCTDPAAPKDMAQPVATDNADSVAKAAD